MYTIYANGQPLHHPNMAADKCLAASAVLREEINTHGSLDVTIEMDNPRWGQVGSNDTIQVRFTDKKTKSTRPIWNGRIATREQNISGTQTLHCEGRLAYLCDSFIEPFAFRGDPAHLLQALITKHNQAVTAQDTERTLALGTVTVTDPNQYIYRYKESSQSVWEAIQEHLVGSSLGGYILLDPVTNEIGYYASYTHVCSQPVRFGVNLQECAQMDDGTGIVNVLYAFGAQNDEDHPESVPDPDINQYIPWYGNRLHLTGSDFPLVKDASANLYGRHYGTMVWDDITVAANLKTAAQAYLDDNYAKIAQRRIEVKAIDMSIADRELDEITVGSLCRVIPPNLWGIDKNDFSNAVQLMCVARDINLIDPADSIYSFGTVEATLSALVGGG